jgi:putative heme iron utilization protein
MSTQPAPLSEPTKAERARTLIYARGFGTLCTNMKKLPGYPHGSIMPYAADGHGRPLFFISTIAVHTKNLLEDPRASLLVAAPEAEADPLGSARVSLFGEVRPLQEADYAAARETYLARHPETEPWIDFGDFSFFRMNVAEVYYIGGFGAMGWVIAPDYASAQVDPLADQAADVLEHMNRDHADLLVKLARAAGEECDRAVMTGVDRYGMTVRVGAEGGYRTRIPFPREVRNAAELRQVLTEMIR